MDNIFEVTSSIRSDVSALIRRLLDSYSRSATPQLQRDVLLQLRAINEIAALTEPVTHFGAFTELQELVVSEAEMTDLLANYRANLSRPEEKVYLARIQNCVLRGQVIDSRTGAERVLCLLSELQRDTDFKLILT